MKRNTDPAFVGLPALKDQQRRQLEIFEPAVRRADWRAIHHAHYDWWMFPIDEPSSYGLAWTVYEGDVVELKQDAGYLERYRRGVDLLATSWGWDLSRRAWVPPPQPDQCWQRWPIRLYKATKSVKLFGCRTEFESLKSLGRVLLQRGETMHYLRDLSGLFRE